MFLLKFIGFCFGFFVPLYFEFLLSDVDDSEDSVINNND